MRTTSLLLVAGICAAGGVAARAAAPPLLADPREETTSWGVPSRSPQSPAARPAAREAQPTAPAQTGGGAQRGNPLWAIPLRYLQATRERPLFSPTRRPPPPAVASMPQAAAPPPPPPRKPPEPEKPQLSLVGTIAGAGTEGIGLFLDPASRNVVRLKTGEDHKGWILRVVQRGEVVLKKGRDTATLSLPPPDLNKGPVPPPVGPLSQPAGSVPPAGPVPLPVGRTPETGQQSADGSLAAPAASPGANPAPRAGAPAGQAAPQPVFTFSRPDIKPTPAAVNPFQGAWEQQIRARPQPAGPTPVR